MKKLLILTVCLMLASSASAIVTPYTDDFGGPVGTLDAGWTDTGATQATTYNGAGGATQASVVDDGWKIEHTIGTGDFHAELNLDNIQIPNGGYGFSQYYLHLQDVAGGFQLGFKTWANVIYVENIDNVLFGPNWAIDALPAASITSFDMVIDFTEATGNLSMDYSFNGGALQNLTNTYGYAGDATRYLGVKTDYWGTTYNAGANASGDIDYFTVTPEPATMALLGLGGLLLRRRRS